MEKNSYGFFFLKVMYVNVATTRGFFVFVFFNFGLSNESSNSRGRYYMPC